MKSHRSEASSRRTAARRTLAVTEARLRAARSEFERLTLESIIDRAKRSLAQVTRELEAERA